MASEFLEKAASLDDVMNEFSKINSRIKSIVSDAVDDGVRSAMKAVRRGRSAAEDAYDGAIDCTKKAVKNNPLEAVGIALAAVVVTGSLVAWLTLRRR